MTVRVSEVLNSPLMAVTDVSTTCAVVIFRVNVSCSTSVDVIDLIGRLRYSLVVCQLSRDFIGYKDSKCHWRVSIRLLSQLNS